MLAPFDIPESLEKLYAESKRLSQTITKGIALAGAPQKLSPNANLLDLPPGAVFIEKDFFKCLKDNKLIRFYSENDLFYSEGLKGQGLRIVSEFATQVILFEKADLLAVVTQNQLWDEWLTLESMNHMIMFALAAVNMGDDIAPHIDVRAVKQGDAIIKEGDAAEEIFLLIQGEAQVTVKGVVVGKIAPDEIFGEISFLTSQPRSATVTAMRPCIIQAIKKENFFQSIQFRPQLMTSLAENLAQRIVKMNEKIV